jgi:sialate O-acetylesterase
VPIGLISSLQGGSQAQLWTSLESIENNIDADPEFKDWLARRSTVVDAFPEKLTEYLTKKENYDAEINRYWNEVENAPEFIARKQAWEEADRTAREQNQPAPPRPDPPRPRPTAPESLDGGPYSTFMVGNLFNAMIAPLMPYGIKGVIWYQGESNESNANQYRKLFPIMITDWREKWGQGTFPFLYVQLPNIGAPAIRPVHSEERWPALREAQASALFLPQTGMATIIDVGDPYDVHGKDKLDVGLRLSLIARHLVYGEKILFKNTGSGLTIGVPPWSPSGKILGPASELKGFAIAGPDRKWAWAQAQINNDQVIVSSDQVSHPVAVRYGWANNPPCNLYNKEQLPATPFRTDDWELDPVLVQLRN